MPRTSWRLSRAGFVAWLLAPVVLVAILWTRMDRSLGKPDPRFITTHTSVSEPTPASSASQPAKKLVDPESLPQGFVVVVEDKSKVASASSPIFFASSHNGWNPGDVDRKLTQRSDGRWQIVFAKPTLDSRIAFKFTRGNWDTVEVSSQLKDVENRLLPQVDAGALKPGEQPTIELTVASWHDQLPTDDNAKRTSPYREVKVAGGRIERVQVVGGGYPLTRDLLVWLPPGYDDASSAGRDYPVLYMQDGQNVFEQYPGTPGEWQADEAATRLIVDGKIEPIIIVGIPHAGVGRAQEYSPVTLKNHGPRADEYVRFLVNEVVPRVERAYRARPGAENRAIGGSSLGGLVSLYAAFRNSGVFGKVLAESPSLSLDGHDVWDEVMSVAPLAPGAVWLGVGGHEIAKTDEAPAMQLNAEVVEHVRKLDGWIAQKFPATQHKFTVDDKAQHDERAWAARFPAALEFLFPVKPAAK